MKRSLWLAILVTGVIACDAPITRPATPAFDVATPAFDVATPAFDVATPAFDVASTALECLVVPDGLVSWWPGDGNFNDIVGTNQPSEVSGVTFDAGVVGQGFKFTGTGKQHIDIPDDPSLRLQQFTVELWATKVAFGANDDIYGTILATKSAGVTPYGDRPKSFFLNWRSADNRITASVIFADDPPHQGNPPVRLVSASTFPLPLTVHAALTFDGEYANLYVNGNLEAQFTSGPHTVNQGPGSLVIGSNEEWARNAGYPRTHNGVIDEVGLFDRALSQDEIRTIYEAGPAGKALTPEQAVETLTETVVTLELQRGIENALSATLNAAARSLANDRPAALQQLGAFNNLVEAMRGGALTDAEADQLIGRAQTITSVVSNCT